MRKLFKSNPIYNLFIFFIGFQDYYTEKLQEQIDLLGNDSDVNKLWPLLKVGQSQDPFSFFQLHLMIFTFYFAQNIFDRSFTEAVLGMTKVLI